MHPVQFRQREETYLASERYEQPKEIFRRLSELLAPWVVERPHASLIDVGCATGELIYFLKSHYPNLSYAGLDSKPAFIEKARRVKQLAECRFMVGEALTSLTGRYDLVTCFGMLGVFDEFEPLVQTLIDHTSPGGRVFVHALFNDYDIDVHISYRDNQHTTDWNGGYNIFSMARVNDWLTALGKKHRFHAFVMPVDLPPNVDFPHRAWTLRLADGNRQTVNGLNLLLPEKLLEIEI